MANQSKSLTQFSEALAECVEATKPHVVAIRLAHNRHITGIVWQPNIVVTSEQSLPKRDEYEVIAAGGMTATAKVIGRDSASNIAILRIPEPMIALPLDASDVRAGAVVIAIGADGVGGTSARMGIINIAGSQWHSSQGGLIDRRIVLDLRLSRREEGGPVSDAAGRYLGMTTFGPHRQVLVIPTATIGRIVPLLLKHGRVPRGWLGVALQAVAVSDALVSADQASGLMVMSIVKDGPAAQAGILPGDIILSVDGTPTNQVRKIARHFGSESIGRKADLRLIRGGTVMNVLTPISERPAS